MYAEDRLNADFISASLSFVADVQVFDEITSTSTMLKDVVRKKESDTTLYVADRQSAGRGRLGRTFFSPPNSGVYFSLLLPVDKCPSPVFDVTVLCAVAAVDSIRKTFNISGGIKWVNDVYIGDKKCVGILVEKVFGKNGKEYLIIGIGANVYAPEGGFGELSDIACAILKDRKENQRNAFVVNTLNAFFELARKDPAAVMDRYISLSILTDRKAEIIRGDLSESVVCKRILPNGNLLVERADGTTCALSAGEVRLKLER